MDTFRRYNGQCRQCQTRHTCLARRTHQTVPLRFGYLGTTFEDEHGFVRVGRVGHMTIDVECCGRLVELHAVQATTAPVVHVCDDSCMMARGRKCDCGCGGLNHGVALTSPAPIPITVEALQWLN